MTKGGICEVQTPFPRFLFRWKMTRMMTCSQDQSQKTFKGDLHSDFPREPPVMDESGPSKGSAKRVERKPGRKLKTKPSKTKTKTTTKKRSSTKTTTTTKKAKLVEPSLIEIEEDCPICCSTYTVKLRPKIACPLSDCTFAACKHCVMRYLSEDTYDAPHCMGCKKPWLNSFVQAVCTKTFWTGAFRDHMQRLVMDRERNALPQSQDWMDIYTRYRTAHQREEALMAEQRKIKARLRTIRGDIDAAYREKYLLEQDLQNGQRRAVLQADGSYRAPRPGDGTNSKEGESKKEEEEEKVKITMGCPREACRGFIGKRSQCGVCKVFVCAKCRQTKAAYEDSTHSCKEEDLASVAFLKKDSKPCPSCAAPIHRISGCSHMWCTACHTAFCWNTMRVLNAARTHNPHMTQWLMQNAGRLGADARRRMGINQADYETISRFRALVLREPRCTPILRAWTLRNHFAHLIPAIRRPYQSDYPLRLARLAYLAGEIDEKGWISKVRRHDLGRQRADAKTQLFETFITGMDGINCRIATEGVERIDPSTVLEATEALLSFFNSSWLDASKAGDLGTSPSKRQISPDFFWYKVGCECEGKEHCYSCAR